MTPVRRSGQGPQVTIEVAPAYELLSTVVTATERLQADIYDLGPVWRQQAAERAGEELLSLVERLSHGITDAWIHLKTIAFGAPPPRDATSFLDHLRQTDADEIRLHAVAYYSRDICRQTPREVIRRAVAGDREAIREFVRTSEPDWEPWQRFLSGFLDEDSESYKAQLIDVLTAWNERVWEPMAGEVMPILERDAEAKRDLLRRLAVDAFFETATNGVQWVPRPGIDRVVMIPSYVNRPVVSHAEVADTLLMTYPVADESIVAERDVPPLRLVRLSKALADEKRLRILRTLAEGEKGLAELAEQFGVPKTTMHHHMIVLRSAGLVSVGVSSKRYRLRHETVPDVGQLLSGYLQPPPASPEPEPAATTRRSV
jgi:DNA-binding transcriptional ArsR family regulator